MYKNEVSNSCTIQKELNRLFGQVNFVLGKLGSRNRKAVHFIKVESHVHWEKCIRRESVVTVPFETTLKFAESAFRVDIL